MRDEEREDLATEKEGRGKKAEIGTKAGMMDKGDLTK